MILLNHVCFFRYGYDHGAGGQENQSNQSPGYPADPLEIEASMIGRIVALHCYYLWLANKRIE